MRAPQNSQNFAAFLGGATEAIVGPEIAAPAGIVDATGIAVAPTSLNVSAILRYSRSFRRATACSTSSWTLFRVATMGEVAEAEYHRFVRAMAETQHARAQ